MASINRIHHLSATVGDPNENLHFYREVLGLRLVKQTVNFEDNGTYHLYFANQNAEAGSVITFFPRLDNLTGRTGAGQVRHIAFAIPKGSLSTWKEHLAGHHLEFKEERLFEEEALLFNDPHGLYLALIETDKAHRGKDILGFYGVELLSAKPEETFRMLTEEMDLQLLGTTEDYYHLEMAGKEKHQVLIHRTFTKRGRLGIGTVHHIAWSVSHAKELQYWKGHFGQTKSVTAIHNRKYFQSAYFRDPGHIIYELATDGPGFTVDESFEELGAKLMLPQKFEKQREEIEESLPKLDI